MPLKSEPYSGTNPVPKAATNLKSLLHPERGTEAKAQELKSQDEETEDKEMEKREGNLKKGRAMHVRDPTTGDDVEIQNAEDTEDDQARTHGQNVLNMEFPPPDWSQHKEYMLSVTTSSLITIIASYTVSIVFLPFIPLPFMSTYPFSGALIQLLLPSCIAYILLFRLRRLSQSDFEDRAWDSERMRGLKAGSDIDGDGTVETEERMKESAEWTNVLLRGIWPIINPDLFQSSVDLLEDIMQSSVPSFIHSVRVADLHQGNNPLRITAIRSLPDACTDESIEHLEAEEKEQFDGDHVNVEVAFAYRAAPSGKSQVSKIKNARLLIDFFMGIKGVWAFRVPVWVELKGVAGTARARLQLIPDPPFVKTTLLTMMGLPRISIEVTPMRVLPNVMNLPVLSQFISNSIDAAAAEYVAPRSLTVDLQQLISGDDIIKDTKAIGVLVVHIHRATGIKKMDSTGTSDPYITLTFSRLGKPMFSSRIIQNDLNPVFEEIAILPITLDNVKLREQLSIQLWDSDRMSADDMMGYIEMDIADRIKHKNTAIRRLSTLESPDGKERPGSVEFTLGYYAKMWPNSALKTDGSDPGIPQEMRELPEFKEARATALNDLEAAVLVTPPDSEYPTGILSVEIHEIKDLSVRTEGKETKGGREGEKGQTEGEVNKEEGEGLPSSYCTISLNDELVYETRVKPLSSAPMFNAGTERVVRDWRHAHVTVVVKDSRVRENDAVLGVVFLKLSELFINASQITRSYPVEKGGRIRISLLFRPVELKLPRNLLGFDTGTIEVHSVTIRSSRPGLDLAKYDLRMFTSREIGRAKITHKQAKTGDDGAINWSLAGSSQIRLPVRQRYSSALFIALNSGSLHGSATQAFGMLWLRDLSDNKASHIEIALWNAKGNDHSRLKYNYVPPDGNLDGWNSDEEKASRIGSVWLDITFTPGVSDAHRKTLTGADAKDRGIWEEFVREKASGVRDEVGEGSHRPTELPSRRSADNAETDQNAVGGKRSSNISSERPEIDGTVPPDQTEVMDEAEDQREDKEEGSSDDSTQGTLKGRWHRWRQEEEALHRDHRGIMQRKPARTVKWLKDNMEIAGHNIKERFTQQEREPDVETEV